ncbi:hypothetical protein BH10BAC6_BH10BAC6_16710 [soil metagenome]
MYKNVLASIPGIEFWPIISLVIFFSVFVGLIVWFFRADKQRLQELAELPLHDASHITK